MSFSVDSDFAGSGQGTTESTGTLVPPAPRFFQNHAVFRPLALLTLAWIFLAVRIFSLKCEDT